MAGISSILSAVQNGVIAVNNLAIQMKGSFLNIASKIAALTTSYDTRTLAVAATIPPFISYVRTAGYATVGDLGGALYRRVVTITSGQLGFTSADGANWQIAESIITPFMAGAKGDGTTDDQLAFQAAINSTLIGGTLYVPRSVTNVSFAISASLIFLNPIRFTCDPGTIIKPMIGFGSNPVLYFVGSPFGLSYPTIIENCFIGDTSASTRRGNYGILFDTTITGNYFRGLVIRDVSIQAGILGVFGLAHINNTTNNPNGGMFASRIEGGTIEGGILFSGSGDNLGIRDCLVPQNSAGGADNSGILISLVIGAGSFVIDHINFSQSGGIVFDGAYSGSIINSQMEGQATSTESNNAIVDIRAAALTMNAFKFRNNQVQAEAGIGSPLLFRVGANVTHVTMDGNVFNTPTNYTPVSNACTNLQDGPNEWIGLGASPHISGTAPANIYGGG